MGRPRTKRKYVRHAPYPVLPDAAVIAEDRSEDGKLNLQLTVVEPEEGCVCGGRCNCKNETEDQIICPVCNTTETEMEIPGALEPFKQYRCRLCGYFYMRNVTNGAYIRY